MCTWKCLEGPRESLGGPGTSPVGSLGVLGRTVPNSPWGVLGADARNKGSTEARQMLDGMRVLDAQDASRSLGTRPDVSSDTTRSLLDRPTGARSAQERSKNILQSPKASWVSAKCAQEVLKGALVHGNTITLLVFQ